MGPTKEFEDKKEPDKKLTREQRRHRERINAEVQGIYKQLTQKYYAQFMESTNPESDDFLLIRRQFEAKWKLTCTRYSLVPAAYGEFKKFADDIMKEYKAQLA